ncbi:hypothetical protein BDR06DRAFT_1014344 [Suillus hirtellus]|nr:hypothetical protein BDR06DRAFT_1014344 [Suillus hirtellus]
MQTFNSLSSASDIIDALHNTLRSRVVIPDLATPFSRASVPNTYLPTTDSNSESISIILTERQQQLDAVSCEISSLETVMDDIKNLRQQLVERKENIIQSMTFHKGLRSAIWRLPAEVLCHIFHHCLPEDKYLSSTSNLTPMLLTRICRPWREVAVDMPSLWQQDFVFHHDDDDDDDDDYHDDDDDDDDDYHYYRRVEKGSDVEVDHRAWQRAVFHYESALNSTSLRELVISNMPHGCDILTMAEYISQLPSTMHVLDVIDSPLDINDLYFLDPVWTHLTQVKITFSRQDAFLHLLHLCPNLSSLTVEVKFDILSRLRVEADVDRQQTLEPFTHTNLQFLCIRYGDSGALLARLSNALSLPSLRVFHACACNTRKIGQWPHKQLIDLIAWSNCPLERLSFCGFAEMNVRRAQYVALIPSLDVVCQWPYNST